MAFSSLAETVDGGAEAERLFWSDFESTIFKYWSPAAVVFAVVGGGVVGTDEEVVEGTK